MIADPKPAKRHVASKAEWKRLHAAHMAACCVSCGHRHQHLHHIAYRSEGGDDFLENLAPLCNPCHDRFHRHGPGWERVAGAIRAYVMADVGRRCYAETKLGERFTRRYPAQPRTDEEFERDFRVLYPPLEPKDLP